MDYPTIYGVSGLALNATGVLLLFFFAMPYRTRTGGHSGYVSSTLNPKEVAKEKRADILAGIGLLLVLGGTFLQILAILKH